MYRKVIKYLHSDEDEDDEGSIIKDLVLNGKGFPSSIESLCEGHLKTEWSYWRECILELFLYVRACVDMGVWSP